MYGKLSSKFRVKKILSMATLASVCFTIPFVCYRSEANAGILSRLGGMVGSLGNSVSRRLSTSGSIGGNVTSTGAGVITRRLSTVSSSAGVNDTGGTQGTSSTQAINSLNQRLATLEESTILESQRANHLFTKAVVASGLVASGAMVAGVIGGVLQQSKFIEYTKEQAQMDQEVQENITNMRNHFQKTEVPEAEQYIIDYYKQNFGMDITKS